MVQRKNDLLVYTAPHIGDQSPECGQRRCLHFARILFRRSRPCQLSYSRCLRRDFADPAGLLVDACVEDWSRTAYDTRDLRHSVYKLRVPVWLLVQGKPALLFGVTKPEAAGYTRGRTRGCSSLGSHAISLRCGCAVHAPHFEEAEATLEGNVRLAPRALMTSPVEKVRHTTARELERREIRALHSTSAEPAC